jgi:hypothetical protein
MLTILGVYHLATISERHNGRVWYPQALQAVESIAREHSLAESTVAGIVAALSPRNRWERNLVDAENMLKIYKITGSIDPTEYKVCTFGNNKLKALQILAENINNPADVKSILSGPKLCEFFSCILGDLQEVCIDGHAYSVWAGDRITLDKIPSIGVKLRAKIKADYKEAANVVNISPAEMQATTWLTWRRLHNV